MPGVRDRLVSYPRFFLTTQHAAASESRAKALLAARAALHKQAEDVVVLDVRALSSVTEFFVVCTADNVRQLGAIADVVQETLAQAGFAVGHIEGAASTPLIGKGPATMVPQWVLMDCGDLVVHVFDQPTRAFYRLEELWADAPRIPLEQSSDAPPAGSVTAR